jgi:hypothetical protein
VVTHEDTIRNVMVCLFIFYFYLLAVNSFNILAVNLFNLFAVKVGVSSSIVIALLRILYEWLASLTTSFENRKTVSVCIIPIFSCLFMQIE